MSMEIGGIGPAQVPGVSPAKPPAPAAVSPTSPVPDDDAVTVDVQSSVPASPPAEVTAAVKTASQAYDQLAAAGKHVKFSLDSSGKLSIEIQNDDGTSQTLSGSDALRLAGGESLG